MSGNRNDLINDLESEFNQNGSVVLSNVTLPKEHFDPSTTDVVFIKPGKKDQRCEVYIDSEVHYQGSSGAWQEIMQRGVSPGNSRLIGYHTKGFTEAFHLFENLIAKAPHQPLKVKPFSAAISQITDLEHIHEHVNRHAKSNLKGLCYK